MCREGEARFLCGFWSLSQLQSLQSGSRPSTSTLRIAFSPLSLFSAVAAKMNEPEVCYILDAILFVYGIVLTALYCHLKIKTSREKKKNPTPALYEPLSYPSNQVYSKIGKGEGGVEMKVRTWEEKVITLVSVLRTRLRMKL
ncbi:high affinity immunoglobulin epsilon receptor subunit gamma isoform X2 [Lithobates pipiens]